MRPVHGARRRVSMHGAVVLALGAAALGVVPGPAEIAAQASLGERLPVREVTLVNGMTVLLLPRTGAPTVSFVMQFAVGGVHERLGTTGIAHLLEHMLFKGTETIGTTDVAAERRLFAQMDSVHDRLLRARGAGDTAAVEALRERLEALEDEARALVVGNEYSLILSRAGAQGLNATTTNEATTYFVELPANRTELFFALEADRMSNPVFREFYSERNVVIEERRMRVESSPGGALYEAHLSAAWRVHPYGVPVVGWMSDLETLRREDVRRYYRDFYGPSNAVLAVVGGFDPDEVEALARRYLEAIPSGREPAPVLAVEPDQRGERRVQLEWDAEPQLRIGWHVPASAHPDAPALAVLSSILTGGRTSRLHRRLITADRVVASIYTSIGPGSRYPRLFQIDAAPQSPASVGDAERAIYAEIETLIAEGVTEREVARVLNQIEAGAVRRVQSNMGLAFQLAESASSHGDWRETFRASTRFADVTPEDVRRVAETYLRSANRTVASLVRTEAR